jgi:Predicted ester cyclase
MQRQWWAAVLLCAVGCFPASSPHPVPAATQHQIALTAFEDVFVRGVGRRDTAAVLRAVAPELLLHIGSDSVRVPREQFFPAIQQIAIPFPDIRFSVDRVVAEGEWAAASLTFRGTHRGTWHGIAATGRQVTVTETFVCRLEAQQLRECWQQWDEAGLQRQLTRTP